MIYVLNMNENGNLLARITIFLVLLFLLPLSAWDVSASLQQKTHKRILVIYGQDRMHPAHEPTEKGILSVVTSDPTFDIEIYPEYMDASRFQGSGYAALCIQTGPCNDFTFGECPGVQPL